MAKSQWVQLALTVVFGPLGLFYSSALWAILLSLAALVFAYDTGGYGALLVWPVAIVTGVLCVRSYNRRPSDGGSRSGGAPELMGQAGSTGGQLP
jgi:hypothetical protein